MKQMKILFTAIALFGLYYTGQSQSIQDLDFLIGTWDVTETIFPGAEREYQETGIRTCKYYLNSAFIKCEAETTISTSGRKRYYVYFINYNTRDKFFSATSLAHDFPIHGQHQWYLNEEKNLITFVSPKNVNEDRFFRGTLKLENKNKIVWEGWSSKYIEDKEWKQIFRDVAIKRN